MSSFLLFLAHTIVRGQQEKIYHCEALTFPAFLRQTYIEGEKNISSQGHGSAFFYFRNHLQQQL